MDKPMDIPCRGIDSQLKEIISISVNIEPTTKRLMVFKNFTQNMQKKSLLVPFMLDTGPKSASDVFRGGFLTFNRQYIASCMVVRSRRSASFMKMCVK